MHLKIKINCMLDTEKTGTLATVRLESAFYVRQAIVFSLFGNWCHCSLLQIVALGRNDMDIIHMETARLMSIWQKSLQVHWKEYNSFVKIKSLAQREQVRKECTLAKCLLLHLSLIEGAFPFKARPRTVEKSCANNTWLVQEKNCAIKP